MNNTDKLRNEVLITNLTGLCEVYEKELTKTLIGIWKNVVQDLTEPEFVRAVQEYMKGPSGAFMPKPGQIFALARPDADRKAEASLMAERIFVTLGCCGADDIGISRAKERLPEIAWAYIENRGGWAKFCRDMQMVHGDAEFALKAQARDSMMGLIDRKKAGKSLLLAHDPELKQLGVSIANLLPEGVLQNAAEGDR